MKIKRNWLVFGIIALAAGGWYFFGRKQEQVAEIEYRYAPVQKGEVVRSISATGQLVALTKVDVKSKAGGRVVHLAVEEGTPVKKGDLIATIDPSDTEAVFRQAEADVLGATARAAQAKQNLQIQLTQGKTGVAIAEYALESAKIRLAKAELDAKTKPIVLRSNVQSAQSQLDSAVENLSRFQKVTRASVRTDANGALLRAKSELDTSEAEYKRQQELYKLGYVAGSVVERAQTALQTAKANYENAMQRLETIDNDLNSQERSLKQAVDRAKSALEEANANLSGIDIAVKSQEEARKAVRQAELDLERAKKNILLNDVRENDVQVAEASTVRSKVSLENAKVQLDSTTVLAPRDGVVTQKYLEEGTIIPPGTSTFAQGTSLVQISDTTQMFVECAVDEADISNVRLGQTVRITTEAFPNVRLNGVVDRVNPAAQTESNVTAVKVRVRILPGYQVKILPGMNATCEFITMQIKDVLVVSSQAIKHEDGKTFALVKVADGSKPEKRQIEVGETGNDGTEIKSGLKEGDEVVVAELNLAELREIQKKMLEAQQGGGLAGGGQRRPSGGSTSGRGSTAGARGGGATAGGAASGGASGGAATSGAGGSGGATGGAATSGAGGSGGATGGAKGSGGAATGGTGGGARPGGASAAPTGGAGK